MKQMAPHSITVGLSRALSSPERLDMTTFEAYLLACKEAPHASAATKRKWQRILGLRGGLEWRGGSLRS